MHRVHRNRIVAALAVVGTMATLGAIAGEHRAQADPGSQSRGEISLRLTGKQAEQLKAVFPPMPPGGYPGEVQMRPLTCTEPGAPPSLNLSNVAFDFSISHPPLPPSTVSKLCVFSVIVGEAGVASGAIVPAKDVPEVEEKEPMYEVQVGYALVGGTWPAAKARRSRAGAPGTQFALELDTDGTERYYLLNAQPGHKVRIHADGATEVVLFSNSDYIEMLPGDTQPVLRALASDLTGKRKAFHDLAVAAAARCGLPGRDPIFAAALALQLKDKEPVVPGDKK